jgi:predicted SprT family Zn-dependent metalloprotease
MRPFGSAQIRDNEGANQVAGSDEVADPLRNRTVNVPLVVNMRVEKVSAEVEALANLYVDRLGLRGHTLWLTEDRRQFEHWLDRAVGSKAGGAYVFLSQSNAHAILINTARIDLEQPKALEIVVCEEFLHMRHWIDGDRRRHAHHGHDRISVQVAQLTGATMEEVRGCLKPVNRRPYKYTYACPTCGVEVRRRRRGTWSCGRCSPVFSRQHVLVLREKSSLDAELDPVT